MRKSGRAGRSRATKLLALGLLFLAATAGGNDDKTDLADRNAEIVKKLSAKTDLIVNRESIPKFLERVAKIYDIPIRIDAGALKTRRITTDGPSISATEKGKSLDEALRAILERFGLTFAVEDGAVVVRLGPHSPVRRVGATVEELTQAYRLSLQNVLSGELRLIHAVTECTAEEGAALLNESGVLVEHAAVAAATEEFNLSRQRNFPLPKVDAASFTDPCRALRTALVNLVAARLPPGRAARYIDEARRRTEGLKQMGIRNIAAELDRRLELSFDQREQIMASLASHWREDWCPIDLGTVVTDYFPPIPDAVVASWLSESQRALWAAIDKTGIPGVIGLHSTLLSSVSKHKRATARVPAPKENDGPPGSDPETLRQRLRMVSDVMLDHWVLGCAHGSPPSLERLLTVRLDRVTAVCQLTDNQRGELELAGQVDIQNFQTQITAMRRERDQAVNDPRQPDLFELGNPLRTQFRAGIFDKGSTFEASLRSLLNADQAARFDAAELERRKFRYRAQVELVVMSLERNLAYRADQRTRFIELVVDETALPCRTGQNYDVNYVGFAMSHIPNNKMMPIFDADEWQHLQRNLDYFRDLHDFFSENGYLDEAPAEPAKSPGGGVNNK